MIVTTFDSCNKVPHKNIGLQLYSIRDSITRDVPGAIAKVMFEMDLYWTVVGGANPVDYFNKYPGRFELWHIKDKKEIGASGMMDFPAIWAAAAKSGMKYGVVEVEEYSFDQFTSCKMSCDFLNNAEYVVMPL